MRILLKLAYVHGSLLLLCRISSCFLYLKYVADPPREQLSLSHHVLDWIPTQKTCDRIEWAAQRSCDFFFRSQKDQSDEKSSFMFPLKDMAWWAEDEYLHSASQPLCPIKCWKTKVESLVHHHQYYQCPLLLSILVTSPNSLFA